MGISRQLLLNALSQIVPFGINVLIVNILGFDSFGEYSYYASFYFVTAVVVTLRLQHTLFGVANESIEALNNSASTVVYISFILFFIVGIYSVSISDMNYLFAIIIGGQVGFFEVVKNYFIKTEKLLLVALFRFINAALPLISIIILESFVRPLIGHLIGVLLITIFYIVFLKKGERLF